MALKAVQRVQGSRHFIVYGSRLIALWLCYISFKFFQIHQITIDIEIKMELDFKIFTLNCWGIPRISRDLDERIEAIGDFLAGSKYDCVCLQEVWSIVHYEKIKEKVSETLPYGHYFFSGVLGSGICMFSKYPIVDVYFHQWPVNGYIHKIQHADWFGGKGVGLCKIKVNKYIINIYTAHLHAEYNRESDIYKAHRVIQAFDTAQFIRFTSGNADLVVLAGDLNTEPGDLAYRLMLTLPDLSDSFNFNASGPSGDMLKPINNSGTNETPLNSYTPSSVKKSGDPGKRIDYILYHPGAKLRVYLKDYKLPLPSRVSGKNFSYSDHEAVSAILHLNGDMAESFEDHSTEKLLVLKESIQVLEKELKNLVNHQRFYLLCSFLLFCSFLVSIFIDVPFKFGMFYNILRSILAVLTVILFGMGTLWNCIENNGVVSNLLSMKILFEKFNNVKISEI